MTARERYNELVTDRRQFLDKAVDCSELTLPYLIQDDTSSRPTHETLQAVSYTHLTLPTKVSV